MHVRSANAMYQPKLKGAHQDSIYSLPNSEQYGLLPGVAMSVGGMGLYESTDGDGFDDVTLMSGDAAATQIAFANPMYDADSFAVPHDRRAYYETSDHFQIPHEDDAYAAAPQQSVYSHRSDFPARATPTAYDRLQFSVPVDPTYGLKPVHDVYGYHVPQEGSESHTDGSEDKGYMLISGNAGADSLYGQSTADTDYFATYDLAEGHDTFIYQAPTQPHFPGSVTVGDQESAYQVPLEPHFPASVTVGDQESAYQVPLEPHFPASVTVGDQESPYQVPLDPTYHADGRANVPKSSATEVYDIGGFQVPAEYGESPYEIARP